MLVPHEIAFRVESTRQILLIPSTFVLTSLSSIFMGILWFSVSVKIPLIVIILPSKFFLFSTRCQGFDYENSEMVNVNKYLGAQSGSLVDIFS